METLQNSRARGFNPAKRIFGSGSVSISTGTALGSPILKPLPHRQKPERKRLAGVKPVTVCIAAIHQDRSGPSIITASDRRFSLLGGWFSEEGRQKFRSIHPEWIGMFAGGAEEAKQMLDAIVPAMRRLKVNSFDKVVDCCRFAYRKQRRRLVETGILSDYNIKTYAEFRALRQSDEALFLEIDEHIKRAQENWSLLFAGFEDTGSPHIFVISGSGKVEYCDFQGRAAIGTGALAALLWTSFFGHVSSMRLGDRIFGTVSAKFFAERASDVGRKTIVVVKRAKCGYGIVFSEGEIEDARKAWSDLPKINDETAKRLEDSVEESIRVYDSIRADQWNAKKEKQSPT
jgi:hypothetical protein